VSESEDRRGRPPGGQRVGVLEGDLTSTRTPPATAGGSRYRLRASVDAVIGGDGSLYLVRAGAEDLVVRDAQPDDFALLRLLAAGEPSIPELAAQLELGVIDVEQKLAALSQAGVVVAAAASPPLDASDAERYCRQLPYLAELGDERDLQRRLGAARITVVGCGGIGTWTIAALASAGVRRLRLVDDDVVDTSNLNRQVLYAPADLGASKAATTARWLRAFDEHVDVEIVERRVDGAETARRVAHGADALVLAADAPAYVLARWINEACIAERVPFIAAGQLPPIVKIGPLYWPGRTACFACHETALRRESADYDAYVRHLQTEPARGATLGPASGLVGATVAMELIHSLIGVSPASMGAALLVDLRTWDVRREVIARDSACAACKHLR
jgi:bacteriocin biosynthesis cyclodehydratase domain-containing protein